MATNKTRRNIVLGAIAYVIGTFPLAVLWHVVAFGDTYRTLGYFGDQPLFLLGLLAIIMQGTLLSIGYSFVYTNRYTRRSAFTYVSFVGVFFWTSHVLAAAAKNQFTSIPQFVALESIYLALQFGLFGVALAFIYREHGAP
ncbi:MAG: hypothetical protein KDB23_23500 [Planctomycetales bacterium]|nr:hypothetical protein [Planctomycetales bacterium]